MKYRFIIIILLLFSCTEINFEGKEVDLNGLSINSIDSDLDIIHFKVDQAEFNNFYANGNSGEFLSTQIDVYNGHKKQVIADLQNTIRIRGVGSSLFDLKSFEIVFENEYDQNLYHFVDNDGINTNHNLDKIRNIRLRNSGQDFFNSFIKDRAYSKLAMKAGLDIEAMYGTKVYHVFVNTAYHGLLNARSESNLKGISQLVGVDENNLVVYKVDNTNQNIEYQAGNQALTVDLENAIDNFSPEELYKLIDISSFIDYLIYQDYIGNFDWPGNNVRMYSKNGEPFRFILFDLDMAGFKEKETYLPRMEYLNYDLAKIYQKCRQISGFDQQLKNRQKEIYAILSPAFFNSIVDDCSRQIKNDISYNIAKYHAPTNYFTWMHSIDLLKTSFADRDKFVRKSYNID